MAPLILGLKATDLAAPHMLTALFLSYLIENSVCKKLFVQSLLRYGNKTVKKALKIEILIDELLFVGFEQTNKYV